MDSLATELTPSGWVRLFLAVGSLLALWAIRWLKRNPPRTPTRTKRWGRRFRR